jgi:hypothetical protein
MFDFYLHDNCNEGDKNTANVGHTYTIEGGDESVENWNILDKADEHFSVQALEVFRVVDSDFVNEPDLVVDAPEGEVINLD